jgi:3-isopropylmalate dehydratase small subunit
MVIKGKAHVFNQDNINADVIVPGSAISKAAGLEDLLPYFFADLRPNFAASIEKGDIIVAGSNFGAGSSREHVALMIKHSGIEAVIARSFSRNFYRNAVNIGLPLVEANWEGIEDGGVLVVDLERGFIEITQKNTRSYFNKTSGLILKIIEAGGLIPLFNKNREIFTPGKLDKKA